VAPGYQPYREELRPYDGVMSTQQPPTSRSVSPLSPVYPFNEPGHPIVLHDGLVGGLAPHDAPGVVALSCVPNLNIVWRIGENSVLPGSSDSVTLVLRRPDGDAAVAGVWRGSTMDGRTALLSARLMRRSSGSSRTGSISPISAARSHS
jgi:hypothetical protein